MEGTVDVFHFKFFQKLIFSHASTIIIEHL